MPSDRRELSSSSCGSYQFNLYTACARIGANRIDASSQRRDGERGRFPGGVHQLQEVASDGGIFSFGNAQFHGSMGGKPLNKPIVGMAADPATGGYWLVASDGGIFAFTAPFYGSMGGTPLNKPIVGMAATKTGGGYWLVASDGGIFAFGNAQFHGSMGGKPLSQPIVGMAADPATGGYWEVASTGGIFTFDAPYHGSATGHAGSPVVGMVADLATGNGYWIGDATGQVFVEGVSSDGTMTGKPLNQPMVGFAVS